MNFGTGEQRMKNSIHAGRSAHSPAHSMKRRAGSDAKRALQGLTATNPLDISP